MKKTGIFLFKFFSFSLITLMILLMGTFAFFQTSFGKTFWKTTIQTYAAKKNITLDIGEVTGTFPFTYHIKKLVVPLNKERSLAIEEGEIRIDWLALLQKKIKIAELTAEKIVWLYPEKIPSTLEGTSAPLPNTASFEWPSFPIAIEVSSFTLEKVEVAVGDNMHFIQLKGKVGLEKEGKYFFLKIDGSLVDNKEVFLQLNLRGDKEKDSITTQVYLEAQSLMALAQTGIDDEKLTPLKNLPLDLNGKIKAVAEGPLEGYLNLFSVRQAPTSRPLTGKFQGVVTPQGMNNPIASFIQTPWEFIGSFTSEGQKILVDPLTLTNHYLIAKGRAQFDSYGEIPHIQFDYTTSDIQHFLPKDTSIDILGYLSGKIAYNPKNTETPLDITFGSPLLVFNKDKISDVKGHLTIAMADSTLLGSFDASCIAIGESFSYSSKYSYQSREDLFKLNGIEIHSPLTLLEGDLSLTKDKKILGEVYSELQSISILEPYIPSIAPLKGKAFINLSFGQKEDLQTLSSKVTLTSFILSEFQGENITLNADLTSPFLDPLGKLSIDLSAGSIGELDIASINLSTENTEENWPYTLVTKGNWNGDMEIESAGFWKWKNHSILLNLQKFQGTRKTHSFVSPKPIEISITPEGMEMKNLLLEMENGSLQSHISLSKDRVDIGALLTQFPIDFFAFVFPDIPFQGIVNLEASLLKEENQVTSQVSLDFTDLQIEPIGEETPLIAQGFFKGHVINNELNVLGKMTLQDNETFEVDATLPLEIKNYPFHISIPRDEDLNASVSFHGQLEDFLDFLNMGPQRLEGQLNCQFELSNTLNAPNVQGEGVLTNGKYEQYEAGILIKNIQAELKASNKKITLVSLKGEGGKSGTIIAQGQMALSSKDLFPFSLTGNMDNLSCIVLPELSAILNGQVHITGNSEKALIDGNIEMVKGQFSLPDKLAPPLPVLDIVYLNVPPSKEKKEERKKIVYPIEVDIDLKAENDFKIIGKGLNSEWKGKIALGGTLDNLVPEGKLSLIRGSFDFSGRSFILSDGKVIFPGFPGAPPQIDITGTLISTGTEIMTTVKGSLLRPRITFSSVPPLPMGSIISLLLFGQDVSEISPIQAAQLAATFSSFADGADLLDKTKQSLGIDRLNIISVPTNTDEKPEQMAVQVGKYVAKGVLVTLSQGPDQGSSNIIVDIDLTHGFQFSAESQQQEEQGKFSFKWHYNY